MPGSRRSLVVVRRTPADMTLRAYARQAPEAIANWRRLRIPGVLRRFAKALPNGARVLDYGCGAGQDVAWFHRRGFRADGLDGCEAFVREARRRSPGATIRCERFESAVLPTAHYDGIWCRAALIHVPPEELPRQLAKLRRALKPGGLLGLTLAWGRRCGYVDHDWLPGRYIAGYHTSQIRRVLSDWSLLELSANSLGDRYGRWIELLARP